MSTQPASPQNFNVTYFVFVRVTQPIKRSPATVIEGAETSMPLAGSPSFKRSCKRRAGDSLLFKVSLMLTSEQKRTDEPALGSGILTICAWVPSGAKKTVRMESRFSISNSSKNKINFSNLNETNPESLEPCQESSPSKRGQYLRQPRPIRMLNGDWFAFFLDEQNRCPARSKVNATESAYRRRQESKMVRGSRESALYCHRQWA